MLSKKNSSRKQLKRNYWFSDEELTELGICSDSDAKKFISQKAYQALRPEMDNVSWNEALRNKLFNINAFRANGIKCAPLIGLLNPCYGFFSDSEPLRNAKELSAHLEKEKISQISMKHVVGGAGKDVYMLEYLGGGKYLTPEKNLLNEFDIDAIINNDQQSVKGYIIERKVELHSDISIITSGALSSVRVITLRKKDGSVKVQGAFIRLGVSGAPTDHASNGGIMAPINLTEGTISVGLNTTHGGAAKYIKAHPDSKVEFVGIKIPYWNEIVDLSIKSAKYSPGIHFIGWDVLVSPDGPCLLEGNVGNSMSIYQQLFGGVFVNGMADDWREHLGCQLPDGSIKWKLSHWDKGRKLSIYEVPIKKVLSKLQNSQLLKPISTLLLI